MTGGVAFSVVIPTYNRADQLASCLEGFEMPEAAGLEVIVVDDGSVDETAERVAEVAARSRGADIRYIWQANAGPGAARNAGVAAARGAWILFLDSDDCWFPWTIDVVRAVLAEAKGPLLFFKAFRFTRDAELEAVRREPPRVEWRSDYLAFEADGPLGFYGAGTCAIRRDAFLAVGGFEPGIRCAEDIDLFYRMADRGQVGTVVAPELVACRMDSADSLSANLGRMQEGLAFIERGLRTGRYPCDQAELIRRLDRRILMRVRTGFEKGQIREPYAYLTIDVPAFIRRWGAIFWLKTAATPLLSLVKPGTYRFGRAAQTR